MAGEDEGTGSEGAKTYSEDEVRSLIAKEVAGIKANRDAALADKVKAREQAEALQSQLDGVQAKLAEVEQAQMGEKAGVNEERLAEIRKKVRADLERDFTPLREKVDGLQKQLEAAHGENRKLKLDDKVKAMMAAAGARSERLDALYRLTADRYDLTEEDEPILLDSRETPLDRYLKETLSDEYPEFYNGSGSSGGGAPKTTSRGGGSRIVAADDGNAFLANVADIASGKVEVRQ